MGEEASILPHIMDSESAEPARLVGGEVLVPRKVVVLERKWFVLEWWDGVRPYVVRLSIDLAVALLVLVSTWCFQWAEKFFAVDGFAHRFFDGIHQGGAVASLAVLASLSVRDIWRISHGKGDVDGD